MNEDDREAIRKILEEVLDEREGTPTSGLLAAPPPAPVEPEPAATAEPAHDHGATGEAGEPAEEGGHEHMPHFLFLVRNDDGEVEEIDPETVPLFEPDLEDEGGGHQHLDKPTPRKKPAKKPPSR
jgi:hypothetical protein